MPSIQLAQPNHLRYAPIQNISDLAKHLQWALSVELSTIPPYLTALYSISDPSSNAYRLIRSVVIEEMLHMMLVGNLMNAIGTPPSLGKDVVPTYPTFIPHHAAGGPYIQLQPLSAELARSVFMGIERPEASHDVPPEGDEFQTIGQFYRAIELGFEYCVAELGPAKVFGNDTGFQRADTYFGSGGGSMVVVRDLNSAKEAICEITEQGEGALSPKPPRPGDERFGGYDHYGMRPDGTYGPILGTPWEMSHYRKFEQIAAGDVALPIIYPMQANPSRTLLSGPVQALFDVFDAAYTLLIQAVERTLNSHAEADNFFGAAFPIMRFVLPPVATLLMQTPLHAAADPALGPNAGPGFNYTPTPLRTIVRMAEQILLSSPPLGLAYAQLWQRNLGAALAALREVLAAAGSTGDLPLTAPPEP